MYVLDQHSIHGPVSTTSCDACAGTNDADAALVYQTGLLAALRIALVYHGQWVFLCKLQQLPSLCVCSIQALLSAPNPDDPLAEIIAKEWREDEAKAMRTGRSE